MGWATAGIALAAFLLSLVLTGKVLRNADGLGLLDEPNARSSHTRATPTGGGLGFLAAFFLVAWPSVYLLPDLGRASPGLLLVLCLPLVGTGYLDDRKGLGALPRYAVQVLCSAGLLWWAGLPQQWAAWPLPWLLAGAAGLVVAVTALINFTNFMDGMDGFVGGVCAVCFAFLAEWCGQPAWWFLAAALAGFLFWNWPPAKIFMGDAGSTPLGLLLACALLLGLDNGSLQAHHLVPLLPLYGDAVYTLLRRTLRLENIFRAHHSHIYQRLMRSGLPHRRVSSLYILLTALCGSLASAWGASGALAAAAVCLACLLAAEIRCARRKVPFTRG